MNHNRIQSINQFLTRHGTEARATMSLSQIEKECLNSVPENVNGFTATVPYTFISKANVNKNSVKRQQTIRPASALHCNID